MRVIVTFDCRPGLVWGGEGGGGQGGEGGGGEVQLGAEAEVGCQAGTSGETRGQPGVAL